MKKMIVGILLGIMLTFSLSYAAGVAKNITVYYDVVKKIIIDGEEKTPTENKPFIYEGTTYVPLRFISESLGKTVTWDGETGTVSIGKKTDPAVIGNTYLTDQKISYYYNMYLYRINNSNEKSLNLDRDGGYNYSDDFVMTMNVDPISLIEKEFSKGISLKVYDNQSILYYNLDGKYKKLTGLIGFDKKLNKRIDGVFRVEFDVDGVKVGEVELKQDGFLGEVDIDVSNGKELAIRFIGSKESKSEPFINLVDMMLK